MLKPWLSLEENGKWKCLSLFSLLYQSATDWVAYKQQKLFLTVLEAEKSQVHVASMAGIWRRPSSRFKDGAFSLCPHTVRGLGGSGVGGLFYKAFILFMRAPPS